MANSCHQCASFPEECDGVRGCKPKDASPTPRQLDLIADIEDVVGIQFTGTNKQEASVFIDEQLDDYRKAKEVQGGK